LATAQKFNSKFLQNFKLGNNTANFKHSQKVKACL